MADDLVERLAAVRRTFPVVLDLGAHHGLLGRRIGAPAGRRDRRSSAEASAGLLAQCDGLRVACDEEVLPFRDRSLDLVVSGFSLQHANDLPGVLMQVRRALKPDGLLLAAMLGGNTLNELRTSLLAAEEELEGGASPRVAPFADVRDLGALLQRAQFALPVVDSETVVVTYANPLALMHELRGMGASQRPERAQPQAAAARHPAALVRDLRRALRPRQRTHPGHLRDPHADRLGSAREPAQAAAAGLRQNAPRRCTWAPPSNQSETLCAHPKPHASVMIEKFAGACGMVRSEFLDLNHTSKSMILVSLMIPKFARDAGGEVWRTSESGH